jgi:hypothetical protein
MPNSVRPDVVLFANGLVEQERRSADPSRHDGRHDQYPGRRRGCTSASVFSNEPVKRLQLLGGRIGRALEAAKTEN